MKMPKNAPTLAIRNVDTAENEPLKVCWSKQAIPTPGHKIRSVHLPDRFLHDVGLEHGGGAGEEADEHARDRQLRVRAAEAYAWSNSII